MDHRQEQPELSLLPSARPFSLGQPSRRAEGACKAQHVVPVLSCKQSRAL